MLSRGSWIALAALALVLGLAAWNTQHPGRVELAAYSDGIDFPVEVMPFNVMRDAPAVGVALMIHEDFHAQRRFSLIDDDVPTAAALGYVVEWSQVGSLSDASRLAAFRAGLTDSELDADAILARYKGEDREPFSAYDDGARLAGIAFRLCGGSQGAAFRFVVSLSLGVPAADAALLCPSGEASNLVAQLRAGAYLSDAGLLVLQPAPPPLGLAGLWRVNLPPVWDQVTAATATLLSTKYRLTYMRKDRLAAIDAPGDDTVAGLAHRKRAGLDLQDRPAALAYSLYRDHVRLGQRLDGELRDTYARGLVGDDDLAQTLLDHARLEPKALRQDAATLAGLLERAFGHDTSAAQRYARLAAFGLPHRLSLAAARDPRLTTYVDMLHEGDLALLNTNLLERDLAALDAPLREVVRRYVEQLQRDYEIRYVQPALKGEAREERRFD